MKNKMMELIELQIKQEQLKSIRLDNIHKLCNILDVTEVEYEKEIKQEIQQLINIL